MDIQELNQESDPLVFDDLATVMSERDHYKLQSQLLHKVNELYGKLAGVTDMATMIETYSIWLAKYVPHLIIGYSNTTRQRKHMYCLCHGPKRRLIIGLAEESLDSATILDVRQRVEFNGLASHIWSFKTTDSVGRLVVLREQEMLSAEMVKLINYSLASLSEPLARTHDFEKICAQARVDSLTGLANRHVFNEHIDYMLKRTSRYDSPLTLVAMDLDHFKTVNDTMGHLYGDEVLQLVAMTLLEQVRLPDILVRMGGDEFMLILPDTDLTQAAKLCERIRNAVHGLKVRAGKDMLAMSIGIAQWEQGQDKRAWLEKADDALYMAKKGGRNQIVR